MSADTQAAFHAALAGHIPGTDAGLERLRDAAEAHAAFSRPVEEIAAEYAPLLEPDAVIDDPAAFQELAEELQAARQAQSIMAGNLPGGPTIVAAEG